jgi:DNA-binding transcriptional ArsR family regulator
VTTTTLDREVSLHKALAHPIRLRILAMLRDGELCVCHLIAVTALAPSTVSAHLADLRRAGLIRDRKQGRWVHVRLADDEGARGVVDAMLRSVESDSRIVTDGRILAALRGVAVEEITRAGHDLERVGLAHCCSTDPETGWTAKS